MVDKQPPPSFQAPNPAAIPRSALLIFVLSIALDKCFRRIVAMRVPICELLPAIAAIIQEGGNDAARCALMAATVVLIT